MKRGKIVLSPFPFTDLSGRKTRPALVISRTNRPGNDVLLAFITTYNGEPLTAADLLLNSAHNDFAQTGLRRSSVVKLEKSVTVDQAILLGELGELSADLMLQADSALCYALEL